MIVSRITPTLIASRTLNDINQQLARIGATQNRLELVNEGLLDGNVRLHKLLSEKTEADYADTILQLNVAQNAYEAALNAAGRVLQTSLLDFIR